ncbi:MAG: hypothetical protein WCL08_13310 [Verrucomicrobiota bacterium]
MLTKITSGDLLLALIVHSSFNQEGIAFFTPDSFSQQLGYMKRPSGYQIPPHVHNPVARAVHFTQEVLFIRRGKVRVDFYGEDKVYLESRVLADGDVILLAAGGHGFEMLEESEIIEVKQGPFAGEGDKTRFSHVAPQNVRIVFDETPQ